MTLSLLDQILFPISTLSSGLSPNLTLQTNNWRQPIVRCTGYALIAFVLSVRMSVFPK